MSLIVSVLAISAGTGSVRHGSSLWPLTTDGIPVTLLLPKPFRETAIHLVLTVSHLSSQKKYLVLYNQDMFRC